MHAATSDAAPDEVTPPLTPGGTWTPERVAWLRAFHTRCRSGLDGAAGEATWAVVADGAVLGSVRLARGEEPDVVETGLWLVRAARGRGVGRQALGLALQQAAALGAATVRAETTPGNTAALRALTASGFVLTPTEDGRGVRAVRRPAAGGDEQDC